MKRQNRRVENPIMNIHEYQAKGLFKQFDIPIPQGKVAFSVNEAKEIAEEPGAVARVAASSWLSPFKRWKALLGRFWV
jgi:hypothetical protein